MGIGLKNAVKTSYVPFSYIVLFGYTLIILNGSDKSYYLSYYLSCAGILIDIPIIVATFGKHP